MGTWHVSDYLSAPIAGDTEWDLLERSLTEHRVLSTLKRAQKPGFGFQPLGVKTRTTADGGVWCLHPGVSHPAHAPPVWPGFCLLPPSLRWGRMLTGVWGLSLSTCRGVTALPSPKPAGHTTTARVLGLPGHFGASDRFVRSPVLPQTSTPDPAAQGSGESRMTRVPDTPRQAHASPGLRAPPRGGGPGARGAANPSKIGQAGRAIC